MNDKLLRTVYDILLSVKKDLEKRITKIDNTIKVYEGVKNRKNNK